MDHVLQFFQQLDNLVWGAPLLVLLVGTGIYLTLRLGLLQIRYLPKAFRLIFTEDEGHGDISSFGALATALAATVGNRQYCRGSDSDSDRWPRGPLLDVDGGLLWDGDQVC